MIRIRRFAVLLAVLVVAVSACSTANRAALVNETEITDDDVVGLRTPEPAPLASGQQYRQDLTTLIAGTAAVDAAEEDFGITGLDDPEARAEWRAQASEQDLATLESIAANPELTDAAVEHVTTQLMLRQAVTDAIGSDPGFLEGFWAQLRTELVEVCPRHVLVATEAEANDARDRLLAGEEFAAVADEVSLDQGSPGGELPCPSNPVAYVEPFAAVVATAPVGEITEPFETQFGWHVVRVDSRESPESYEEFAADAERWLPDGVVAEAWTGWLNAALARATIEVRSQIGTWFPEGDGILPPPASP